MRVGNDRVACSEARDLRHTADPGWIIGAWIIAGALVLLPSPRSCVTFTSNERVRSFSPVAQSRCRPMMSP